MPPRLVMPALASLLATGVCLVLVEVGLRVYATPDPLGVKVGQVILRPFDWATVARNNRALANQQRQSKSFIVPDPDLGWTVGQSRVEATGLYKSSAEGLRSANVGESLTASVKPHRVALFGDSFTFSNEVPFDQSLGAHLERELGGSASVLNFGVSGYGLDQAYLRFKRDAPAWQPNVAVLNFIEPDLIRMASVYIFLKPGWKSPFSKPRFVLTNGKLALKNAPTLNSEQMFSRQAIQDLPFLDLDVEYVAGDWQAGFFDYSYALRYLRSTLSGERGRRGAVQEEIHALGVKVIEAFVTTARERGIVPIVAYLPTKSELTAKKKPRILRALKDIHDLTECIAGQVPIEALYRPEGHFTDAGNRAAAKCIAPIVNVSASNAGR